jgi:hypothetical protein
MRAGGVQACITCAFARCALRAATTTTSSFSSTIASRCAPLPRHSRRPCRCRRRDRCDAYAVDTRLLCSSAHACPLPIMPWQVVDYYLIAAQILAAEVPSDKWQIQEWTFATVSAAAARSFVLRRVPCCV